MPETPSERLAVFAAEALDWTAVREVLRPLAPSALGSRALDELAPRDADGASEALERARELEVLLRQENLEPPLAGTSDPRSVLEKAERFHRPLDGEDLVAVARFLRTAVDLQLWIAPRRERLTRCAALFARMPDLSGLREALDGALDRKGGVRDDASPLLARVRREIAVLEAEIARLLRDLARDPELRSALAEGHGGRVLRRGGRPVLAVRARQAARVVGIVHDRSQTGETLFIEPERVVQPANALAALEADAGRETNRILTELTRGVLAARGPLRDLAGRASELELAVVAARYARETGGSVPRLPEDGRALVLRGFRHPLLLVQLRKGRLAEVVPLDLRLGREFDLLVITGPNTGGKTLALKSAGLAALMTRLGLSLPCEEGTLVPLYEGVAADIGDEQEIQQNLSTFSSHLVRIRAGLARASERVLVLLDELGGGTDPTEGAALGEALLEELLARGVPTLASTHLGSLKEFAYRHERAENAHVEFDADSLRPLFRLVIGAPGESRALAIARRLGLPAAVVERAAERLGRAGGEAPDWMHELRGLRLEAERMRAQAEERALEVERERAVLAGERDELAARKLQLEAEAQRGIEERLARSVEWVARGRSLLPQIPPGQRAEVERVLAGLAEALGDAALSDRRASFLAGLKKGSLVWLPRFKKRCQVTRIHKEKRELEVKLGARELRVSFDDVTFYESL